MGKGGFVKGLVFLFVILSISLLTIGGIFYGLNKAFEKNNINQIIENYVHPVTYEELKEISLKNTENNDGNSGATDPNNNEEPNNDTSSIDYGQLGDISAIFDSISGGNLDFSNLLSGIGEVAGSNDSSVDIPGFASITGQLGTVSTVIDLLSGNTSTMSIFEYLLGFVGAKDLFTKEMVQKATNGFEVDGEAINYINIDYFMKSNLATHMVVELCYMNYSYISDRKVIETWDTDTTTTINGVLNEYEKDLQILINKDYEEIDKDDLSELKTRITLSTKELLPNPQEKLKSVNGIIKIIIAFIFTNSAIIYALGIVLLFFVFTILLTFRVDKSIIYYAIGGLISAGSIFTIGFLIRNLLVKYLSVDKIANVITNDGFNQISIIMASISAGLFLLLIIITLIRRGGVRIVKRTSTRADVPDGETLQVMSSLGILQDINDKDKTQQQQNTSIVDYYGDGRGLKAQKDWQNKYNNNKK